MTEPTLQPLVWLVSTQMLLYAVAWLLCTVLLREERKAVAHWGAFMLTMSVGFLLIGLRGEPRTWLAYSGANVLVVLGYVLARRGFECFMHRAPRDREHLLILGLTTLAFIGLGPSADNAYWRVIVAYGASALIVIRGALDLTPAVRAEYGPRASFIIVFPGALVMLVGVLRVVQQVLDPSRQLELHLTRLNNTSMILAYLIGAATFNFSYMTMVMVRLTRRLQTLSQQDSLTGLPNRRVIEARLDHEWQRWRRRRTPMTVLAVDLDHFKRVNDTWGHPSGDEMLVQVGQRLQAGVRQVDTVARTGGEEFLVLLPDTDLAASQVVAERLRASIATQPFLLRGTSVPMSASLGCAEAQAGDVDIPALLERADAALYRAKETGRNRVCSDPPSEAAPASFLVPPAAEPDGPRPAATPSAHTPLAVATTV